MMADSRVNHLNVQLSEKQDEKPGGKFGPKNNAYKCNLASPHPALSVMHFSLAKSYLSQQMFSMKALHKLS